MLGANQGLPWEDAWIAQGVVSVWCGTHLSKAPGGMTGAETCEDTSRCMHEHVQQVSAFVMPG